MNYVSPLRVTALTCDITVTYFSINFINVFSYITVVCLYISDHYLVFHTLFPSISTADIDYTCITSVGECSKSVRLLLK